MKLYRLIAGIAGFAALAAAGMAVASGLTSSRTTAYYAPGKHQFYVWCPDGKDRVAWQTGNSAEDAQDRLYAAEKAAGANCWPVWQGRVPS